MSKGFKKILIGIIVFFVLLYIVTLFIKKDYAVERNIVINQEKTQVFDYVKHIKNQAYFLMWLQIDSLIKTTSKGIDGTEGFTFKWDGEQIGKGEEEIISLENGKRIDFQLRFAEPVKSQSSLYMITDSISKNQTKLTWGMKGKVPYPANVMMLFLDINDVIGKDIQRNLDTLKVILSNKLKT